MNRDKFFGTAKPQAVSVPMPETGEGESVLVWPLTAKEWTAFQAAQQTNGKPNKLADLVRERLVVACVRDESGQPLFTVDDISALGEMPAGMIERIVNAALKLIGITGADAETFAKN